MMENKLNKYQIWVASFHKKCIIKITFHLLSELIIISKKKYISHIIDNELNLKIVHQSSYIINRHVNMFCFFET